MMRLFALVLAVMPQVALALEYCDEMWFTRNLIFDRAGYCFGSPLGQAVFDNADCRPGQVSLSPEAAAFVKVIRQSETLERCQVDTNRRSLRVSLIEQRKRLVDLPVPSLFESACIGWLRPSVALRAARSARATEIGRVGRGDTLLFQYEDAEGWSFVEVMRDERVVDLGWMQVRWGDGACAQFAG